MLLFRQRLLGTSCAQPTKLALPKEVFGQTLSTTHGVVSQQEGPALSNSDTLTESWPVEECYIVRPVLFLFLFLPFVLLASACSSLTELRALLDKIPSATQATTAPSETATPPETAATPAAPAPAATRPPPSSKPAIATPTLAEQCKALAHTEVALKSGQKGEKVATLQQLLSTAGFYRHEVDGVYDAQTRSAVIAFHKALDLPRTSLSSA